MINFIEKWIRPLSILTVILTIIFAILFTIVWAGTGLINLNFIGLVFEGWIIFSFGYVIVTYILEWRDEHEHRHNRETQNSPSGNDTRPRT